MVAEGFDAVLHFAALSLVGESVTEPVRYFKTNVGGSLNLLDAMRAAGCRRLVFSSTAAVYGEPETVPIPESAPTRPTNPYGASKIAVDMAIGYEAAASGLGAVSLRYFNVAGASGRQGEQHDPETHLIPSVLKVASGEQDAVRIFGTDYPHPRRDGDPGLHPCRRPGPGPPAGPRRHRRARPPYLQPRQRHRLLGPGGARHGPAGDRLPDPCGRISPSARRPTRPGRLERVDPHRARVDAAEAGAGGHGVRRLALDAAARAGDGHRGLTGRAPRRGTCRKPAVPAAVGRRLS